MGIAGPITSALIGAACLALALALGWTPSAEGTTTAATPPMAALIWLGYINIMLAVFNMVPGFPLDGGRVLRAIIWWATGNADRSTRIAARIGQLVAIGFIVWGIFNFFSGAGFGGLWMAFIGWFLLDAARVSYAQVEIVRSLKGRRVADVMTRDCPVIDGNTNLQTFTDEYLLKTGRRCFIVVEQGKIAGLITLHEVKEVERSKWAFTTVDDVMRPLDSLRTVQPETPIAKALELMGREDVNQLPVTRGGQLEGIISRGHIVRLLQASAELNRS
jgi:CBS domain-containing protein